MSDISMLNDVQQVLRAITICLALEQKADMARLGAALAAFSSNRDISPTAQAMLADIATGVSMLGRDGRGAH